MKAPTRSIIPREFIFCIVQNGVRNRTCLNFFLYKEIITDCPRSLLSQRSTRPTLRVVTHRRSMSTRNTGVGSGNTCTRYEVSARSWCSAIDFSRTLGHSGMFRVPHCPRYRFALWRHDTAQERSCYDFPIPHRDGDGYIPMDVLGFHACLLKDWRTVHR